jgi:hypothetical protein
LRLKRRQPESQLLNIPVLREKSGCNAWSWLMVSNAVLFLFSFKPGQSALLQAIPSTFRMRKHTEFSAKLVCFQVNISNAYNGLSINSSPRLCQQPIPIPSN